MIYINFFETVTKCFNVTQILSVCVCVCVCVFSPPANSKNVNWLLGRDGDVAVIVIGEVDELASKFICSGFGEKKAPSLQNNAQ